MRESANIKELENEYRGIMKDLHNEFRFDFNKPFIFYKMTGHFTINKAVDEKEEALTIILIKEPTTDLYTVKYSPNVVNHFTISTNYTRTWNRFVCKADFEAMRKSPYCTAYILTQKYGNLNKHEYVFDEANRYKPVRKQWDSEQLKYTLTPINLKGSEDNSCLAYEYIPYFQNGDFLQGGWECLPCVSLCSLIDKSGYLKWFYCKDLHRKARNIKAQKAKCEYLKIDTTGQIETLERLIERYKAKLSSDILTVTTTNDINYINKLLNFNGLYTIVDEFRKFKSRNKNKEYASIEESNEVYDRINKLIYEYI